MASSGNFTKWSPLFKNTTSNYNNLLNGNTRLDGSTNNSTVLTDFAIPVGTKFYAEVLTVIQTGIYAIFGIAPSTTTLNTYTRTQSNIYGMEFRTQSGSLWTVNSISNTTVGSDSSDVGQTAERVIGIAVNRVDNELKLYLDNTLKFTLSIPSTGEYHFFASHTGATGYTQTHHNFNGGHDSTGAGDFTVASNADENGFGEFQHSPPSGHLACCSANLPISADIDPAQTDDNIPSKQFNVLTYNASGGDSYTGLGFKPDLVWVKWRGGDQSNGLFDSSRGTSKVLNSDNSNDEATSSGLTAFGTDGFTMGNFYNQSGRDYVAWCWRANGGVTSSNTGGTITSTVQANTSAGFSIVKFAGDGNSNATVGHGLNSAPDFIICKPYESSSLSWHVFHRAMGTGEFILNSTSAFSTRTTSFTESGTTATNFTLGSDAGNMNYSGVDTIAYCWHSVEGSSKFGSYEGNGNADGAFIYTGFRPRMLFVKDADRDENWQTFDSARNTFNPVDIGLMWNSSSAESTGSGSGFDVDFLSNGFKMRCSHDNLNGSSTYIYGAWGDVPFKYNNTF